ncbi:hypothetical protein VPHK567_0413 [Vibrio phage K567]
MFSSEIAMLFSVFLIIYRKSVDRCIEFAYYVLLSATKRTNNEVNIIN